MKDLGSVPVVETIWKSADEELGLEGEMDLERIGWCVGRNLVKEEIGSG
jgi:hypothetical protein